MEMLKGGSSERSGGGVSQGQTIRQVSAPATASRGTGQGQSPEDPRYQGSLSLSHGEKAVSATRLDT